MTSAIKTMLGVFFILAISTVANASDVSPSIMAQLNRIQRSASYLHNPTAVEAMKASLVSMFYESSTTAEEKKRIGQVIEDLNSRISKLLPANAQAKSPVEAQ